MKNRSQKIIRNFIFVLFTIVITSCSSDLLERIDQFGPLNPKNNDELAGNWKTILLTSPDEFSLEVPVATTTPAYAREINEIKSYQDNITEDQKRIIKYWSAGGVLRWNEIMRTLVARHNTPPYQNEDGTYPVPSSTNPFANPEFPFSSPPYAARAYAYVSAAQYDALVATWYYKKLYNRAAPFNVDTSLQVLIPKSALPSYPSEDAVLAGVTIELLKLLFPTEIAYINGKADEEKLYRIISGANVRSDLDAGIILGRKIATKYISRATTDGTGSAVGTAEIWASLETQTIAQGEIPWKSLESPIRPPMLPLFGKV